MKRIVKINPFYVSRIWGGGKRLIEEFNYHTEVAPLGEVFNVVALANHADCFVPELDMTLSELYLAKPAWFNCDTKELPIRVNILDPVADLSIQLHPDDAFAYKYNKGRGKPEAWVILDTIAGGRIQFGHQAKSLQELVEKSEAGNWEGLLNYLTAVKDGFIDIPVGTLHALGKGVLTYNISRNADCTLRLFDYGRIDPQTNSLRDLQVKECYENVKIPDSLGKFVMVDSVVEKGIEITRYWDEPGLYTLMRLKINNEACFNYPRFAFYTCVDGAGYINDVMIRKGETLLVPDSYGEVNFKGKLDIFLNSYTNIN